MKGEERRLPRLHNQAAGTVRAPHTLPTDRDVSLSDVLAHGAADKAHRVGWFRGPCRRRGCEEVEGVEMHSEQNLMRMVGLEDLEMSLTSLGERCCCCRTHRPYI